MEKEGFQIECLVKFVLHMLAGEFFLKLLYTVSQKQSNLFLS